MKILIALLAGVFLSSCAHTAIAPVANEAGVPVVVRVPGVRAGQQAKPEQLEAISRRVENTVGEELGGGGSAGQQADPGIIGLAAVGMHGEVVTKRGEKFTGFFPMVVLKATYPPDEVDRAAGRIAAAYYRAAKKHYRVVPVTDLKSKPKEKP